MSAIPPPAVPRTLTPPRPALRQSPADDRPGMSFLALLSHPAQWQALCADPDRLAPKVVEEVR